LLLSRGPDRDASVRTGSDNASVIQIGDRIHGAVVKTQYLLSGIVIQRPADGRRVETARHCLHSIRSDRERAHRSTMSAQLRLRGKREQQQQDWAKPFDRLEHRHSNYLVASAAIGLHTECADPCAHTIITQRGEKYLHTWALTPIINDKKIVVFRRNRQKSETVQFRHRFDGKSPVGATRSNCRRDGVVRFRLIGVAGWARTAKYFVSQHARAGAGVAVDHQGRLICQNNFQRFVRAATLKTSITWPEHKALHPPPARDEDEALGRKMLVILSARWIDEMDGGYVAFTAIGRGHTT